MMVAAVKRSVRVYPKQQAFITEDDYSVAMTGGRGSGKTKGGAFRMLLKSKPNCTYGIVAPSYKMMDRSTLPTFRDVAIEFGLWTKDCYREVKQTIDLDNGAKYLLCSADNPESLRGPNLSGCWFDEMQESDEKAYSNLLPSLREHGKRGWMQSTFTPGSPDHWTSKRFIKCCTVPKQMRINTAYGPAIVKYFGSPDGDVSFFRASTKENTFQERAIYEGLLKDYAASPMRIRRELEGECIYMEGAEWMPEYFDDIWFNEWPAPTRNRVKVLSLDPSLGKDRKIGDYAAYIKCLWQDGLMYIDADMRQGQDSSLIAHNGVNLYCDWMPHFFAVEQEMGMHLLIAEMLKIGDSRNIPIAITPIDTEHVPKEIRIRSLTRYVSNKQFRFKANSPGAKILYEQMLGFPLGEYDDGPDSLAQAVKTLLYAQTGRILPPRQASYGRMEQAV